MTPTNATWTKHPGFYIKEEMEAREWLQRDLAFILGVPEQAVNMILAGKRGISADMALALADAFDTDRDFFANLQKAYDLAHARTPDPSVALRGSMQSQYPVREMIKRGWITKVGNAHVRRVLVEAAWSARHPTGVSRELAARRTHGTPAVVAIAHKAQMRLPRTYWRLLQRGKAPQVAVVAVARELAGFVWAILQQVPKEVSA